MAAKTTSGVMGRKEASQGDMMIKWIGLAAALLSLLAMAGCEAAAVNVKQIKAPTTAQVPRPQSSRLLQLKRLVVKIPKHEVIGSVQVGPFCMGVEQLFWKGLDKIYLTEDELTEQLHRALTGYGYKLLGGVDQLFDEAGSHKADLVLGGMIRDLKGNICYSPPEQRTLASGEAYMRVHWQLYDPRQKKVLLRIDTEGSFKRELIDLKADRGRSIWLGAFGVAVAKLAANSDFRRVLTTAPVAKPAPRPKPPAPKPPAYDKPLSLTYAAAQSLRMPADASSVRAAMVGVSGDHGKGAGFFISPSGYLLTTARAVAGGRYVKVKLAGSGALLGEVLRRYEPWDVALVRVKATVAAALPIASGRARVGASVFAVSTRTGKPLVRKGEVKDYVEVAAKRYLFSDINIPEALAGSPLVDRHGAVVGIAVNLAKTSASRKGGTHFVPILEVFKALNLQ